MKSGNKWFLACMSVAILAVVCISCSRQGFSPWQEVKDFLEADETDLLDESNCVNIANAVRSNAREAGLDAAYVVVHFQDGTSHALNALDTTDKGRVFIDCVGRDKVAYIEVGKEYGTLPIEKATGFTYSDYEAGIREYKKFWAMYQELIDSGNWEAVEEQADTLHYYLREYGPWMNWGIVTAVDISW